MNIEQLNLYIENKEPLDQRAISQIMLLIEKYPYFQTAHFLLLKAMYQTQPEKYNGQLKISASFISDKRKLYQYIHSENEILGQIPEKKNEQKQEKVSEPVTKEEIKPTNVKKEEKQVTEEKVKKEENKIEIKSAKEPETVQIEEAKKSEEPKKEEPKDTKVEKTNEPQITKPELKKKVDLTEEEIEQLANQNSEIKHKKLVNDFFFIPEKKVNEPEKQPELKKEASNELKEKKEFPGKQEIKTLLEEKKRQIISKNEPGKIEKALAEMQSEEVKKETSEVKKEIDTEKTEKKEPIIQKEIKEKIEKPEIEKIKTLEEKNVTDVVEEKTNQEMSDTMSSIFSKIRQIKKEMNIETPQNRETIDINPTVESSKITRIRKAEDGKTPGKVIKESFIGFEESEIKKEDLIGDTYNKINTSPETEEGTEKEVIKESGLTAKDLFKQQLRKKENTEPELLTEKTQEIKSPITKIVENINQGDLKTEEKEKADLKTESIEVVKKAEPIITETKIGTTETSQQTGELSAAEILLKRIADKKRKMQEEKEQEEKDKLIKETEIKEEKQEPIAEAIIIEDKAENVQSEQTQEEKNELQKEVTEETVQPVKEKEKKSQFLIDSFIEKVDTLERIGKKETTIVGDISEKSTEEKDDFMTETLADLFIQQKNYQKAIEIYHKLILKFPEKKTYFAIQIKKTESLIK